MKRKITLLSLSMALIMSYSFVKLSSNQLGKIEAFKKSHLKNTGGAPAGKTGAPGESNCTDCHSGVVNDGTSINALVMTEEGTTNIVTQYITGQTYDISLAINTTSTKKGFQAVALKTLDDNQAGTITAVSGSTATSSANSRTYINHTSASTGAAFFSFKWTAPSTNVGDVKFYVAANSSNNANGNNGDLIYLSQHTFSPAPEIAPTAGFTVSSNQICVDGTVNFTDTSSGSVSTYAWSFPGGTPSTSTDANPTVSYASEGTYTATLTASNSGGSSSSTLSIEVLPCLSTKEATNDLLILYPNPSSDRLTIKNIDIKHYKVVQLIDLKGKTVASWQILNTDINLNLETIDKGSYFVKIIGEKKPILKPITKF